MKRILVILCLLAGSLSIAQAQDRPDSKKMIQDRLTNMKANLKLSANEGKVFWPAYEQFLRNEIKYHDTFRTNLSKKGIKDGMHNCASKECMENLSDAQITYLYDQRFELRKNMLTLEANFYKKIKSMLTPKHIRDFYSIDEKFKRSMVAKKKNATGNASTPIDPNAINQGKKRR